MMKTLAPLSGCIVVCLLALLVFSTPSIAQFNRTVYGDRDVNPVDVNLEIEYNRIKAAMGNSEWWNSLSEEARHAIRYKVESKGKKYLMDDLHEIMAISRQDMLISRHNEVPAMRSPCPMDITLTTQDEVDAFGRQGCSDLAGNLFIEDACCSPKITDLTPLSDLTRVVGILRISASELTSLEGLSNIESVGYLDILHCHALTNLEGLSGLTQFFGRAIEPCSWSDFQSHIEYNTNLVSLQGLDNLTDVSSGVFIRSNSSLKNLDGLGKLRFVGGALSVENNPQLDNIESLSSVETVSRDLVIRNNESLSDLNGLQNVRSVGIWAIVDNNDQLIDLQGLSGLTTVGGRMWVINNEGLESLEGLNNLTSVGQMVMVEKNAVLRNLEGLSGLTSTQGVSVFFNPQLTSLDGIASLKAVGSDGLNFWGNNSLSDINAISNITSNDGWLVFQELPALTNIDAALSMTRIGGVAGVATCPLMKNVDGFSNITYIGGDGGAFDMEALENLDGFSHVNWMGGTLFCHDNPSLSSMCGIHQLLCAHPPTCETTAVGGSIVIYNNLAGLTPGEIVDAGPCKAELLDWRSSQLEPSGSSDPLLHPNPATDEVYINLARFSDNNVEIRLINNIGKVFWQRTMNDIDDIPTIAYRVPQSMQNGMYYFILVSGSETLAIPVVFNK